MTSGARDFDLLEQPWITVLDRSGVSSDRSLRQVFRDAPALSAVGGELPTQAFAILRLLVTIVRRSIRHRGGSAVEIWSQLWSQQELPLAEIDDYLSAHSDRFRLFDPAAPFFQVADLRSSKDAVSGLDRLIADVPNGEKYFTTRAGSALERIDFAEAARWLVHVHAFDPSGIKTGAEGDPRVKGGKGYPIGVAWTGCLGGVYLEGATLRETLLLNLVLLDLNSERFVDGDEPVWERDPDGAAPRSSPPRGPDDLATWQSRRVRLVRDDTHVTGVVLCNGDAIEPFNHQVIEPMSAWRYSEIQSKKAGDDRHYPMTHNPERALWRGFAAVIAELAQPVGEHAIAPGVVEWVHRLLDEQVLDERYPIGFHSTGMEYINNQSVVGGITDDTIGFRAALLASDPQLRVCAINAVDIADKAVYALGQLAYNLARAASGDNDSPNNPLDGARNQAKAQGYFALEQPYRRWLATLKPIAADADTESYDRQWHDIVFGIVNRLGNERITVAGKPAWVGRDTRTGYLDTAIAEREFRGRLRHFVPMATTTQPLVPEPEEAPL